ncbi:MAG: hypothetical protein LBM77_01280 [Spirochaetaceae bacterium]|jgi:hypothetical protein|nr:hypothetical protein [Spirochaetaceae bacterium]
MPVAKQQITIEMVWNLLLQLQREVHQMHREQRHEDVEESEGSYKTKDWPIFTEDYDPVEWCKPIPLSAEAQADEDEFWRNYDREKVQENLKAFHQEIDSVEDEPLPDDFYLVNGKGLRFKEVEV